MNFVQVTCGEYEDLQNAPINFNVPQILAAASLKAFGFRSRICSIGGHFLNPDRWQQYDQISLKAELWQAGITQHYNNVTHKITIMNTTTYSRIKKMSPQFLVSDIDRSIEFYKETLGFDIDFRYEDFYVGIIKDGCSIHLKLGKPSLEERKRKKNNEDLDIVFSVGEIETLYEELSNKPIEFVQRLREQPYGKEFYVTDPDGYIIAFMEEQ